MKYKTLIVSSIYLLGLALMELNAQESIPTGGSNISSTFGSVSYTVGQFVYTTYSGTNGYITQGVQQPYEISLIEGIRNSIKYIFQCTAFPNPANEFITLEVETPSPVNIQSISYLLYNSKGILIENNKLNANNTILNIGSLNNGIYILKLLQHKKELKTFKIIKTNKI